MSLDSRLWETRLTNKKKLLLESLDKSKTSAAIVELDQSRFGRISRNDAMQSQAMSLATQALRKLELKKIEAALNRLKLGTYGECALCREAINSNRLLIDPANPFCTDCADEQNR
ncbi:MAG: TraR/DksA C4-type zinc finger protein [Pseudomonadota bacterium]|nr:TraR/DksA C4-type zinc finger protein [Pseudomonadota bacterium]